MELVEYCLQEQPICNSIPRGGPIFVPDTVSPITSVAEFETSIFEELQSLKAELCDDSSQAWEDDLSVDELKVFSEEELVEKALKEAFKDGDDTENYPHCSEEHCNEERKDDRRTSSNGNACLDSPTENINVPTLYKSLDESLIETGCNGQLDEKNSKKTKKRGRIFDRDSCAAELESNYIARVERLARLKQKQDEDKAAAKLHSFSCKTNEEAVPSSDKVEKMTSLRSTAATKVKASILHEHVAISYPEVVLSVEIYHNKKTCVKSQEFLVLGLQTLTELRDNIYCLTDQLMQKAGQHDPSGYFFIEDIFYNDLRDPSAIDYSEPIFNWFRNSKDEALEKWECIINGELQQKQKAFLGDATISHLPHFKAVDMHKARFCDLRFRLGAGYIYCHQGNCKHTFVIRDMRLIHPEDVQNRAAYPVLTFQLKSRFRKCAVCKIFRATKVTVDDKWAQENPCYFCDNCYYLLHYTEDGSLLYHEFTVYDYHHE